MKLIAILAVVSFAVLTSGTPLETSSLGTSDLFNEEQYLSRFTRDLREDSDKSREIEDRATRKPIKAVTSKPRVDDDSNEVIRKPVKSAVTSNPRALDDSRETTRKAARPATIKARGSDDSKKNIRKPVKTAAVSARRSDDSKENIRKPAVAVKPKGSSNSKGTTRKPSKPAAVNIRRSDDSRETIRKIAKSSVAKARKSDDSRETTRKTLKRLARDVDEESVESSEQPDAESNDVTPNPVKPAVASKSSAPPRVPTKSPISKSG